MQWHYRGQLLLNNKNNFFIKSYHTLKHLHGTCIFTSLLTISHILILAIKKIFINFYLNEKNKEDDVDTWLNRPRSIFAWLPPKLFLYSLNKVDRQTKESWGQKDKDDFYKRKFIETKIVSVIYLCRRWLKP